MRILKPEWISGNVFLRENLLENKGDKCIGHKHNFDHTTFVLRGSIHVKAILPDGRIQEGDFGGDNYHFLTRAGVEHELIANEDNTLFVCTYAHTTPQGTISQVWTGWRKAYE